MGKKVGLYGTGGVIWDGCEYMYMDIMRQWGYMGQASQITPFGIFSHFDIWKKKCVNFYDFPKTLSESMLFVA